MTSVDQTPGSALPEAAELATLRAEVRELVRSWRETGRFTPQCDAWLRGYDPEFSAALAERGWIGLTWPRQFGGSEASNSARQVLTEELLRAGAPVAGHWMGDRQIGPAILRYGTDALQQRYLSAIAAGEVTFCLGMSETESGSDLASVRTTATPADGGWRVTGRKIWTSHAHRSTHAYVLARSDRQADKHEGLSEFIVDLSAPGVEVRPIYDLRGDHHFNEVSFDDVFVPADHVLGQIGNGWTQVTEQLAFERGGMERVLSTYPLLEQAIAAAESDDDLERTGGALALIRTLRRLGRVVAGEMDRGAAPVLLAAVLKDVGTIFEGDVNELGRHVLDTEPDPFGGGSAQLLADGILAAPGFTIRGGATEVLRSIVSRSGVRAGRPVRVLPPGPDAELRSMADDVLADRGGEPERGESTAWEAVVELGWPGVGQPEEHGGSGGELADLLALLQACGRHVVSVPMLETAWAGLVAAVLGASVGGSPATVAVPTGSDAIRVAADGTLTGTVGRVPWGQDARAVIVVATDSDGSAVAALVDVTEPVPGLTITPGQNVAAEPRDTLAFDAVPARVLGPVDPDHVAALGALLRAAQTAGALETALEHTVRHVSVREQFGKALIRFQSVGALVAQMIEQVTLASMAVRMAAEAAGPSDGGALVDLDSAAVAAVVAGAAATIGTRMAHQLHGAVGVTREHPLHLATRRLWSWRDELGGDRRWARVLGARGRDVARQGSDRLFDWVVGL